jgi:5-methylcytosine-specific restriction endonuclease McrA
MAPLAEQVGRRCRYCRRPMMPPDRSPTREHMRPRSRLEPVIATARNRVFACEPCNGEKADRTLIEFLALLIERRDPRAQYVAAAIQSLCARGLDHLCGVNPPRP